VGTMTNVVILGFFPYPRGMAGTKRIQHVIDGLKSFPDISLSVIVTRQASSQNTLCGIHGGVCYETILGDSQRWKFMLKLPYFFWKSSCAVKRAYRPDSRNVLYVYGPVSLDNLAAIKSARKLGYKVIVDIVEDFDFAGPISKSLWQRINNKIVQNMTGNIAAIADGLIVISSHLDSKFRKLTSGTVPIHYKPVSVDIKLFSEAVQPIGDSCTLFYSGSFGVKDGLPVLLDAFDMLAAGNRSLRLVMTGIGDKVAMLAMVNRIASSPFADRIDYKGYLGDAEYYQALQAADIPCMTRVNIGFAQAGFPFKLGEFLASGKPVIASRVSDVGQILVNRQDALLVEPDNPQDIVEAVEFILNNRETARLIGARGHEKAAQLFDYRAQGEFLHSFMEQLGRTH